MNRELRYKSHNVCVIQWIEESTKGMTVEELLDHFEKALNRLNERSKTSINEMTLSSIFNRVLYNASENHSILLSIKIGPAALDFVKLRSESVGMGEKVIRDAFQHLITEYFFIIGNLTAEQLIPMLRETLVASDDYKKNEKV